MSSVVIKTDIQTKVSTEASTVKGVVLFNCNCHTFDEVAEQIMKAIGCSIEKAFRFAYVADQLGSVVVYEGERGDCEKVASILGSTGLQVKVV